MKLCERDGCSNRARKVSKEGRGRLCETHHRRLHPRSTGYKRRKITRARFNKYKLTRVEYEQIKQEQGSKCKICGDKTVLVIDHCHKTNVVRGLLCSNCNTGIGLLKESVEVLLRASVYMKECDKRKAQAS